MMQELDAEPTIDELKKALNCLSSGKAPEKDGIRPEIVKLCRGSLLTDLHAILSLMEGVSSPTGHARLKYRHHIQEQGRQHRGQIFWTRSSEETASHR